MNRKESPSMGGFTIAIMALFLAGFLLLVILGAKSFKNASGLQNGNNGTRVLLSYLSTTLRGYDAEGAVTVREEAGGQVLEIAEGNTGYSLKLYTHEGKLMEEFTRAGRPLNPEEAEVIGETAEFSVEQPDPGVLLLKTDAGTVLVHLRSEKGGGQ
ncbi:MAG: DUF4860 domain-containing protein [Eubacterium sp.]|nr:DUF4860 domain-containing protein [Eubacterium sp.]